MTDVALELEMSARSPEDYADFLLPFLDRDTRLLDIGCGHGALSLGLAPFCRQVTGVDVDAASYRDAQAFASRRKLPVTFEAGDATELAYADHTFDAVLAHSVLEAGPEPAKVLGEARRVLKPGGWLGAASVEYGGLVIAGPEADVLIRSNTLREQLWQLNGSDPFLGRHLRGLFDEAGFVEVTASTKAFSYGTPERTRAFAAGRAAECADEDYVADVVSAGWATADELAAMASSWTRWGQSPAAYAAFTWCRALGRTPTDEELVR